MKYFKDDTIEKEKKGLESKVTEEKEKNQALQQELKELKELKKEKEEKPLVEEKKSRPSNIDKIKQSYSQTQMVNEDGYCYIGTDDNMRHCVNAYVGDVCTSGDVYKRVDDCLIPKSPSDEACYL
jgi:DNA repair ATPase RecN